MTHHQLEQLLQELERLYTAHQVNMKQYIEIKGGLYREYVETGGSITNDEYNLINNRAIKRIKADDENIRK